MTSVYHDLVSESTNPYPDPSPCTHRCGRCGGQAHYYATSPSGALLFICRGFRDGDACGPECGWCRRCTDPRPITPPLSLPAPPPDPDRI